MTDTQKKKFIEEYKSYLKILADDEMDEWAAGCADGMELALGILGLKLVEEITGDLYIVEVEE